MVKLLALFLGLTLAAGMAHASEAEELRGMWVTRFEWPSEDPAKCKENITHVFEALAANNFNTAFFQVRGAAETLYPSSLEPWSPVLGEKDPGFDPVQFAIDEARRNGISFHAYINPIPLRLNRWPKPKDKNHLFHSHGPNSDEPWVCMDKAGKPLRSGYYYLAAGIPGVHVYIRQAIMDFVRRYDIDGVHLDRIRYPSPSCSFDPISTKRFRGRGNPNRKEWGDWQREQLDKLINDLAVEIRAEKPNVLLSCAAWGIYNRYHIEGYYNFSSGYHDYYQDTWKWCRLGAMDFLVPMIYWNMADPKPNYDELMEDFVRNLGKDCIVGGQKVFSTSENAAEINFTRELGALGTVLFSISSAEPEGVLSGCKDTVYQTKADVPTFERVTAPENN